LQSKQNEIENKVPEKEEEKKSVLEEVKRQAAN
jgi:hypothetical protein